MITLVAAMDESRLIGANGDLPWRIPEDLKHFKRTTLDGVMVMGSTTWKSFGGRTLPRRHHVVLTRNVHTLDIHPDDAENVSVVSSLDLAILVAQDEASARGVEDIFIVGGADVYRQTIGRAERLILTQVNGDHNGDTYFPEIGPEWEVTSKSEEVESNGHTYSIVTYSRQDL